MSVIKDTLSASLPARQVYPGKYRCKNNQSTGEIEAGWRKLDLRVAALPADCSVPGEIPLGGHGPARTISHLEV